MNEDTYFPDERTKQAYVARARRLDDLTRHEGWKDFVEYAQSQVKAAINAAASHDVPHKAHVLIGAANAVSNLIEWPKQEVDAITNAVELDNTKAL